VIINGWQIYNHAVILAIPPHTYSDVFKIENGSIWSRSGGACELRLIRRNNSSKNLFRNNLFPGYFESEVFAE
jgi:hypothetical protein